jgi:hypothetical protein
MGGKLSGTLIAWLLVVHEYENILSTQSLLATLLDLGGILFISLSHIPYTINCISLTVDYNYHSTINKDKREREKGVIDLAYGESDLAPLYG